MQGSHKFLSIVALLTLALASCQHTRPCLQRVAAFDIGSGSTKMLVADVNQCQTPKTITPVHEEFVKLSTLTKPGEDINTDRIKKELSALKQKGISHGALRFRGIATAGLRKHPDGPQIAASLARHLDMPIDIATPEQEAELGFHSASSLIQTPVDQILVWDIGGGSMQLSWFADGRIHTSAEQQGSATFLDQILKTRKDPLSAVSPYSKTQLATARSLALQIPLQLPPNSRSRTLVGIGGVHRFSVIGQLKSEGLVPPESKLPTTYTLEQVEGALQKRYTHSIKQLKSEYANTEVSNLVLVSTLMKKYNWSQVTVVNADLTRGLISSSDPF